MINVSSFLRNCTVLTITHDTPAQVIFMFIYKIVYVILIITITCTASESKALIGDITPKSLQVTPQAMELSSDPCTEDPSDDAERMKVSSWNHAG
jgi:hypothetical protein